MLHDRTSTTSNSSICFEEGSCRAQQGCQKNMTNHLVDQIAVSQKDRVLIKTDAAIVFQSHLSLHSSRLCR